MSEETTSITPTRPYMVRALYQWIEDNALTPYLMVDATADNVQVPKEHVQDGRIVLNIASRATDEIEEAMNALIDVSPTNVEAITALQRKANNARGAIQWLMETISAGDNALRQLEEE